MNPEIMQVIVSMNDAGFDLDTILCSAKEYDDSITEFEVEQILENMG